MYMYASYESFLNKLNSFTLTEILCIMSGFFFPFITALMLKKRKQRKQTTPTTIVTNIIFW